MTEFKEKMKMDMELRSYSPITIKYYIGHLNGLARYFNKSPELLGENEIREYLHYCITEKHLKETTANTIHSALRFFYENILERNGKLKK